MRIRTDGKYAYRQDEIEWASDFWGCNKTQAVLRSIEFTRQMTHALNEVVEHPEMTTDLADLLSTSEIEVVYQTETDVVIQD